MIANDAHLADVFAAPLIALEDAGFAAARAFLQVIREFGFIDTSGKDQWGALRFISLTLRHAHGGEPSEMVVDIPVLSLIPLPLLEVRKAQLEFDVRLLGIPAEDVRTPAAFDFDQGRAAVEARSVPGFRAAFAGNADASDARMHVKLTVAPSNFPSGITNLLSLLKESTNGR
jgi:hypothetical protein